MGFLASLIYNSLVPFVGTRSSKVAKIFQKKIRVSFPQSLPARL